jgi:hypothetical protein
MRIGQRANMTWFDGDFIPKQLSSNCLAAVPTTALTNPKNLLKTVQGPWFLDGS